MKKNLGLLVSAVAAQLLAAGLFVGGMSFYQRIHPGQEGWGVLIPCLIAAFSAGILVLWVFLRWLKISRSFLLASWLLTSWLGGVAIFLIWNSPRMGWLVAVGILFLLLFRHSHRTS